MDVSEWFYYDMYSLVSDGGCGLNYGYFYIEFGRLVVVIV